MAKACLLIAEPVNPLMLHGSLALRVGIALELIRIRRQSLRIHV
jgi:hypothetical protein